MALNTRQVVVPKEYEVVSYEQEYNKLLQDYLDAALKKILGNIKCYHRGRVTAKAMTDDNLAFDFAKLLSVIHLKDKIKTIVKSIIDKAYDSFESDLKVNIPRDRNFEEHVMEESFSKVKGLSEDLAGKLREESLLVWENGGGVSEVKAKILELWGNSNLTDARAEMIARTETISAYNGGRFKAAKDSGLNLLKRWNAYRDNRTGEDSKRLEDKYYNNPIPLDEYFIDDATGEATMIGPNRPNCRCRTEYVRV